MPFGLSISSGCQPLGMTIASASPHSEFNKFCNCSSVGVDSDSELESGVEVDEGEDDRLDPGDDAGELSAFESSGGPSFLFYSRIPAVTFFTTFAI
jgi:hypothetical protein